MSPITDVRAYRTYVENITGGKVTESNTKTRIISRYTELFNRYALRTPDGVFIKDPSQKNQIVSEGQAYWQILAADLARIDPAKAAKYQENFDALLKGTQYMIRLAKASGSWGEFPAWKVKQSGNSVVLDRDQYGPTANSAADADLDIARSLIYAQNLVEQGLWANRGYDRLLNVWLLQARSLFVEQNGVLVLGPSEDWNEFSFTDYLDPAGYKEIAAYLTKQGRVADAAFWEKAAGDSMKLYAETLNDTGTFPAQINVRVRSASDIEVLAANNTRMSYDGIRSPWRIARYITMFAENNAEAQAAKNALAHGSQNNFSHTLSREMDAAMYLPLSVALGSVSSADLADRIFRGRLPRDNYFDNTLELLGLVDTVFPRKVNINNTPSAAPVAPPLQPQTVIPAPQAVPLKDKPVALPVVVMSGWDKDVSYTASKNVLTVHGIGSRGDYDSLALGAVNAEGYSKLVVTVESIRGRMNANRYIGISIDSKNYAGYEVANYAAFPAPVGKRIADNLIDGQLSVGEQLVYDIAGKGQIYLGAKVYVEPNVSITYSFELQK
ncbi:hypothetical protein NO1_0951 [Candidatus Termititenax aidoneus]|uniref:Uncharacterized protein n=1 Tax=Termititenax aidoneus TaxID=2218524 RepID=A0A388TBB9_TERA1|nr:hypothetical protein NO1_0951 [Candidatus Termititenax aidoneus]